MRGLVYVNTTAAKDGVLYRQMQSIHRHQHRLALSQKLRKVTLNLGVHFIFCVDSKKLICNPDTNKQLMHKYAHNFKTKGEQLYLRCKGGFLSLSKQHRARLKSQNPPHVCAVCVFAPACLPPDVLFPSPACLSSLSL